MASQPGREDTATPGKSITYPGVGVSSAELEQLAAIMPADMAHPRPGRRRAVEKRPYPRLLTVRTTA